MYKSTAHNAHMTSAEALFAAMWKGALLLLYERERCPLCETDCVLRLGPIDLSALKCLHNDARDFLKYSIIAKLCIYCKGAEHLEKISTFTQSEYKICVQRHRKTHSASVILFFIRNKALYDCYKHEIASFFIHTRICVSEGRWPRCARTYVKKHVQREVAARCAGQHGSFEKSAPLTNAISLTQDPFPLGAARPHNE
jgi:hypothetical protein